MMSKKIIFTFNYLQTAICMKKSLLYLLLCLMGNCLVAQELILTEKKTIPGFADNPCFTAFSPDGNYMSLTTSGARTELRDKDFNEVWSYNGPSNAGAGCTTFTPDNKFLIFSKFQAKGDMVLLRLSDKKIMQRLKAHEDYLSDMTLSRDGKMLATCGSDSKIQIYQWKNEQFVQLQTLILAQGDRVGQAYANNLIFSPDGKFLIAGGRMDSTSLKIFSLKGNQFELTQSFPNKYDISALAFHPKGPYFVACTSEFTNLYKLTGNKFVQDRTFADINYIGSIRFSPDGKYLAGSRMNIFKVWAWNNGSLKEVHENEMHRRTVISVSFSADGNYLVSTGGLGGDADRKVIVWQMPDAPVAKNPAGNKGTNPLPKENKPAPQTANNDMDNFMPAVAGKNFLLVVGINNYKFWTPLANANKDAKDVKDVLTRRYTFDTQNVFEIYNDDATAKNILAKITEARQKISANDNLLIYFSGHGFYNAEIEEGFWIPVDAHKGQETEYLPNSTLLKYLKSIPAKHIFLVADACFSGSLISSASRGFVENVEQFKSRRCLTSGYLEFVSDGNAGANSPFASYFLKFLQENQKKKFACSDLEQYVKNSVGNNADQTPRNGVLRSVGDEGGEFVFYLK
jgi:Caspase domain/WD domain, G-beta repeat/WD40-like Beta Propeller Repeat